MTVRTTSLSALAVLCLISPCEARAASLPSLDLAVVRAAPTILEHLKKHKYQNVGVLKFLVQKGKGPLTDNAGPLNLDLARRLEMVLIHADKISDPMNVIKNASAVAAELKGASHLTEEGRALLFEGKYQPAWGAKGETVRADAFLTGEVQMDADLKAVTVIVLCFDKKTNPTEVSRFKARTGVDVLVQGGESFVLRGDGGEDEALENANRVRARKAAHPLDPKAKPLVMLEVRYDNKRVPLEGLGEGQARAPEPRSSQKVSLVLRRTAAAGSARLAVVLKVNGVNTLFPQKDNPLQNDLQCVKWILSPGAGDLFVKGFQTDKEEGKEFKVLAREDSNVKAREVNYKPDLVAISLVVFREQDEKTRRRPATTDAPTKDEAQMMAIIARGAHPATPPKNRAGLWNQLEQQVEKNRGVRGVIDAGAAIDSRVTFVSFVPDPVPVQAATIIYYRPVQRGKQ